jgi:hypothetical protein
MAAPNQPDTRMHLCTLAVQSAASPPHQPGLSRSRSRRPRRSMTQDAVQPAAGFEWMG